jgi:hypothetical protein
MSYEELKENIIILGIDPNNNGSINFEAKKLMKDMSNDHFNLERKEIMETFGIDILNDFKNEKFINDISIVNHYEEDEKGIKEEYYEILSSAKVYIIKTPDKKMIATIKYIVFQDIQYFHSLINNFTNLYGGLFDNIFINLYIPKNNPLNRMIETTDISNYIIKLIYNCVDLGFDMNLKLSDYEYSPNLVKKNNMYCSLEYYYDSLQRTTEDKERVKKMYENLFITKFSLILRNVNIGINYSFNEIGVEPNNFIDINHVENINPNLSLVIGNPTDNYKKIIENFLHNECGFILSKSKNKNTFTKSVILYDTNTQEIINVLTILEGFNMTEHLIEIYDVCTKEGYRGRGYSSQVISKLVSLYENDYTISLGVIDPNPLNIYLSNGFVRSSIENKTPLGVDLKGLNFLWLTYEDTSELTKDEITRYQFLAYDNLLRIQKKDFNFKFLILREQYLEFYKNFVNNKLILNEIGGSLTSIPNTNNGLDFNINKRIIGPIQNPNHIILEKFTVDLTSVSKLQFLYHTHPYRAYIAYNYASGFPSPSDFVSLLNFGTRTHLVPSLEGLYCIQYTSNFFNNYMRNKNIGLSWNSNFTDRIIKSFVLRREGLRHYSNVLKYNNKFSTLGMTNSNWKNINLPVDFFENYRDIVLPDMISFANNSVKNYNNVKFIDLYNEYLNYGDAEYNIYGETFRNNKHFYETYLNNSNFPVLESVFNLIFIDHNKIEKRNNVVFVDLNRF